MPEMCRTTGSLTYRPERRVSAGNGIFTTLLVVVYPCNSFAWTDPDVVKLWAGAPCGGCCFVRSGGESLLLVSRIGWIKTMLATHACMAITLDPRRIG